MVKPQLVILIAVLACSSLLAAPPVRKFDDPNSPPFKVLKTGENPPLDVDGNFVIGPEYVPAEERKAICLDDIALDTGDIRPKDGIGRDNWQGRPNFRAG